MDRKGQFGYLFDNVEDTLTFARFQTFNFDGWSDYPDILEPLLFYVLQRASSEIEKPANTATFKVFVIDEAWIFLKNAIIRDWIMRAEKTWRKKNAAMILATQSVVELADAGHAAHRQRVLPHQDLSRQPQHRPQAVRRNLPVERYPA